MEYFFLGSNNKKGTAFAWTEENVMMSHEIIPFLKEHDEVPFSFSLKNIFKGKTGREVSSDLSGLKYLWTDFPPNNLAWPMMSEKMKDIVAANLTGEESIRWIKMRVHSTGEIRAYFIPFFDEQLNVLNEERTLFVEGTRHIIIPCFAFEKVEKFGLFNKPGLYWQLPTGIYINENIKEDLLKAKISGVDFEKVRVA